MQTLMSRRAMIAAAALPLLVRPGLLRAAEPDLADLRDITTGAVPIDAAERARRLSRAQALMKANGIGAILIEPGSTMIYFTGVRWGRSERLTAAILPVEGEPCIVTPFFEEPSVRETLAIPAEVRVWQEDQNPLAVVAGYLRDRKLASRPIGIEETARFFAFDGLQKALPGTRLVSANPVVRGCRMVKTRAEIALMQVATDVTMAAYRWLHPRVEAGMTGADIGALMSAATRKLGGNPEFSMALIGEASAYPHGSKQVHRVADGQVVLMDCGCTVQGYQSDVSRSWVHGRATTEQRKVWDTVAKGQQVARAAARIGAPAGSIDDAVRRFYEREGYGPDYRLPGLSHRTGHGIGMDGHEPVNLVRGEAMPLAPGMCFSNEPGLYLPGKFGIRLEDCFHMADSGPVWFSKPPTSIDAPIG
ncbi:metallopeptidase [Sphingomonas paucimobilis]|jgi:Xaa-Pro aminopeptidase|uniref:Aminopeptidase P family protein n=3 Tax=Sphingomonadaceae TaxID=41297 RepID=A0A411LF75_SPHPI|nr:MULTISPECIES: Xaa-Pro peptidase family protein [Sphingomonas]RSU64591.1 aminopeptidase P family protein [Sphingomonas sp. S-NIH.Pt1_0416]GAN13133.1 peptidase M24 family protein [Sphingomonas paucimobilis NBRC 13935]MBQ1480160.1 aminopeptidase P family protein [Sphingomonas sp.]MDG5971690.1 Xaa-Pro peptidase family protein [Sphingomonas paucimobilis]NNG58297.1 aminopeptidase P family protein [Sphingomonas paucimobilis]